MITHVIAGVLFLLPLLLWIGLIANLGTMNSSDPAGRGLAEAFALFTIIGLYVLLFVMLLFAGWKGSMPSNHQLFTYLWFPASCALCIYALYLMHRPVVRWPIVIPVFAPLPLFWVAVKAYLRP